MKSCFSNSLNTFLTWVFRLLFPGILELRQRFDRFLAGAGEHELPVLLLQLASRNRDVVFADTEESARADDGVGHRTVGRDDDVIDASYFLVLFVVDRLAEYLFLCAPA